MERRVLAISHFDVNNKVFEGYCNSIKAKSDKYYYIDYLDLYLKSGKRATEKEIEDLIIKNKIDYVFFILRSADLTFDVRFIERLSKLSFIIMNFCDSEYFFEPCDRYYAQTADIILLTDYLTLYKYKQLNVPAVSTFSLFDKNQYLPLNESDKDIDVSFVGNVATSNRKEYADYLINNGVSINLYGANTLNGFVDFEMMIDIFNRSKININFSGTIITGSLFGLMHNLNINRRIKQLKGRSIEVALCGGFVLSEYAPGIENMFKIGEEIDIFHTKEELLEKVRYYLNNDEERERIARRGYERALRDYDCVNGFAKVFAIIKDQRKTEKMVYLDKEFIRNYVGYRFFYITSFLLTGKVRNLFEELKILLKFRRIKISYAFQYTVRAFGMYLTKYPMLKKKIMGSLGIPYRD